MTADALGDAINLPSGAMRHLLEELAADGLVERDGPHHWRLTEETERKHGRHLRGMT